MPKNTKLTPERRSELIEFLHTGEALLRCPLVTQGEVTYKTLSRWVRTDGQLKKLREQGVKNRIHRLNTKAYGPSGDVPKNATQQMNVGQAAADRVISCGTTLEIRHWARVYAHQLQKHPIGRVMFEEAVEEVARRFDGSKIDLEILEDIVDNLTHIPEVPAYAKVAPVKKPCVERQNDTYKKDINISPSDQVVIVFSPKAKGNLDKELKKEMLRIVGESHDWNRTHMAKTIGVSIRTLRNWLDEYVV